MTPKIIYTILFISILIIEISIALFLKSGFIRHTFGDFLATILVFSFIKMFNNSNSLHIAIVTLVISYTIELAQLFNVLAYLNLENNRLVRIVFGNHFSYSDLIAYTLGIMTIYYIDLKFIKK